MYKVDRESYVEAARTRHEVKASAAAAVTELPGNSLLKWLWGYQGLSCLLTDHLNSSPENHQGPAKFI